MSLETEQETLAEISEVQTQTNAEPKAEVVTTEAQTDGAEGEKKSGQEKTFTQAELDAILQRRLAKERRQLRSELRETVQMAREIAQPTNQNQQESDGKPRREQFQNEDDWLDARDAWRDAQREATKRQADARSEFEDISKKTTKLYAQAAKLPGFDSDAFDEAIATPGLSRESLLTLVESDVAPQLMAHFASNPEDVERIAKLSPLRQAAELGKLEDKVAAKPQTTKAPAPLNGSVKGSGSGIPDLERADFATYKKLRAQSGARWAG